MTLGSGLGATLGIMEDIGADGTILGHIGGIGDGTTLGIMEDTGECIIHGIRIMQDGMEDWILIGDTDMDTATEDTSSPTDGTGLDMKRRATNGYLPEQTGQWQEGASAQVQAQAEEPSEAPAHREAAYPLQNLLKDHLSQEGQLLDRMRHLLEARQYRASHLRLQTEDRHTEGRQHHPVHHTPGVLAVRAEELQIVLLTFQEALRTTTEAHQAATAAAHRLQADPQATALAAAEDTAEEAKAAIAEEAVAVHPEEEDKTTIKTDIS